MSRLALLLLFLAQDPEQDANQDPRPNLVRGELTVRDTDESLQTAVQSMGSDGWLGYAVPATTDRQHRCAGVFRLDQGGGFTSAGEPDPNASLFVFYRVASGAVSEVHAVSSECRIDPGATPVAWRTSVSAAESIAFLDALVRWRSGELAEHALHALARHADPRVDERIEAFATGEWPRELREKAVFWLGAARGEGGYRALVRVLDSESERALREKTVFALHVSRVEASTETLIRVARADADPEIREKALFWLAQTAGKQAAVAIAEAVRDDPELEEKEKAVFALSQLPPGEGVPLLIEVAETHPQPEIRKKAFFWLGQSGDEQALALIEKVLLENR